MATSQLPLLPQSLPKTQPEWQRVVNILQTWAGAIPVTQLQGFTVATLPTPTLSLAGTMVYVTDAVAPTYNSPLTGGGSITVPVFCDGTTWTAH